VFGGLRPNRGKKLYNPKTIAEAEAEYHRLADDPEAREILYAQRRLKLPGYLMVRGYSSHHIFHLTSALIGLRCLGCVERCFEPEERNYSKV
jgi:hypothetical protein